MNNINERGVIIESFYQALKSGESGLKQAPTLLKKIMKYDMWQKFYSAISKEWYENKTFMEFITDKPLKGLGEKIEDVKNVIKNDIEALDLFDKLTVGKPGGDNNPLGSNQYKEVDNNSNTTIVHKQERGKQYAIRKLRKDRPDLHKKVLNNLISPNAAMIEAGFRKKTFTVVMEVDTIVNAINKHFKKEDIVKIINKLTGE